MRDGLFALAALGVMLSAAPASAQAAFELPPEEAECVVSGANVHYRGASEGLGACLDSAGVATIAELRVASRGGDAQRTLADMQRYAGRIDLVIVDGFCGSSCANYVLPTARRLIVPENAYVMVHGSIDAEQVRAFLQAQRPNLLQQGVPEDEVDEVIANSVAAVAESEHAQDAFAEERLSCLDWLRPHLNEAAIAPTRDVAGLIAAESMARRCLKHTHIESYWSAASDEALPALIQQRNMVLSQ